MDDKSKKYHMSNGNSDKNHNNKYNNNNKNDSYQEENKYGNMTIVIVITIW